MTKKQAPLEDMALGSQHFWTQSAEAWLQSLNLMTTYWQPARQMREQWWQYNLARWDQLQRQWRHGLDLCNTVEDQLREQTLQTCRQMMEQPHA